MFNRRYIFKCWISHRHQENGFGIFPRRPRRRENLQTTNHLDLHGHDADRMVVKSGDESHGTIPLRIQVCLIGKGLNCLHPIRSGCDWNLTNSIRSEGVWILRVRKKTSL